MKVAIRADASSRIGSGHVMRCKTLADELRAQGSDVRFVCRERPGNLIALLTGAGYRVTVLPPSVDVEQSVDADEATAAIEGFRPDWLVVDHYGFDEEWESRLRRHVGRVLVIDDLADRRHTCDVLLDQNWFADDTPHRYDGLVPGECRRLLGPHHALLQPVFRQLRQSLPPRDGIIRRVLVFFGGVDSYNQTVTALKTLQADEFRGIAVDVVIGHANEHEAEIESLTRTRWDTTPHRDLTTLAGLMARADLMLGAGGATTWERCCLGLPSIVAITGENQERFTTALAAMRAQYSLGRAAGLTVNDWTTALQRLLGSPEDVKACAAAARLMTDGFGVNRVATVLQQHHIRPTLRRATRECEPQLSDRMTTTGVQPTALLSAAKPAAVPAPMVLIGEDQHGLPLGQACVAFQADEALVAITVDVTLGRQGLSAALLRGTMEQVALRGVTFVRSSAQCAGFVAGVDSLRITVVSDHDSWLNDHLEQLVFEWFTRGHAVRWIHDPADLMAGDVCFLLGCGTILSLEQIRQHRHTLAVHESDLPRGRGWSPLTWQVLEGADRIAVSLFETGPRVDAGPIYLQTWITLDGTELVEELRACQADATITLCREWINRYPSIVAEGRPQAGGGTIYRRRTPKDSELDLNKTLGEQFSLLRVVDSERYPAFFSREGERYLVTIRKEKPVL